MDSRLNRQLRLGAILSSSANDTETMRDITRTKLAQFAPAFWVYFLIPSIQFLPRLPPKCSILMFQMFQIEEKFKILWMTTLKSLL